MEFKVPKAVPPKVNPATAGLWSTYKNGDEIDVAAWRRAAADGSVVGTCRSCAGYLAVDSPVPSALSASGDKPITWFQARCLACGQEMAAPNGRIRRRS